MLYVYKQKRVQWEQVFGQMSDVALRNSIDDCNATCTIFPSFKIT